jgi:hypothetical protein
MPLSAATGLMRRRTGSKHRRLASSVLVALVAIAGCASTPGSVSPTASATPSPTPQPVAVPLVCAGRLNAQGADVTTAAELERAATFRREMGFPSDDAHVRVMACRVDANLEDIPLTVEELRELERRTRVGHAINEIVQPYAGKHAAEFGGIYIDNRRGGVVTVLWTANLPKHEAAIRALLDSDAAIAFRQVRWSEMELGHLQERIGADRAWFGAIQAALQTTSINVQENIVEIGISSANPDASALIIAHFAAPAGMMRVISDGTGVALLPWATVNGRVITAGGTAPGENNFRIEERPGGPPGTCGGDEGLTLVEPTGGFELRCQVGVRIIRATDADVQPPRILGESRVEVPAEGVVFVEIIIDRHPQP